MRAWSARCSDDFSRSDFYRDRLRLAGRHLRIGDWKVRVAELIEGAKPGEQRRRDRENVPELPVNLFARRELERVVRDSALSALMSDRDRHRRGSRSEERRVGKGGTSWWG